MHLEMHSVRKIFLKFMFVDSIFVIKRSASVRHLLHFRCTTTQIGLWNQGPSFQGFYREGWIQNDARFYLYLQALERNCPPTSYCKQGACAHPRALLPNRIKRDKARSVRSRVASASKVTINREAWNCKTPLRYIAKRQDENYYATSSPFDQTRYF